MNGRDYRTAFLGAALIACVLGVTLGVVLWQNRAKRAETTSGPVVVASGPPAETRRGEQRQAEPKLGPIQISPQRLQSIGIKTAEVELKAINDSIRATGSVVIDEERVSSVQVRFPGFIQRVFADATYQYVSKGQPLFTIYSPDLVSTEQEYLLAKQDRDSLSKSNSPTATEQADWLLKAASERLRHWGVSQREIARLESTGKVQREITIDSPVSGYITERNALPNQQVQPGTRQYTIADLSTVWIEASIFQNDLGRIAVGDPASVTVDTYPARKFSGRVSRLIPQLDPATRTGRVRLALRNPDLLLKPGMFVNVEFGVPIGKQLVVPASAVLETGTRQIAFVDHGDGNLEPREITVGTHYGDDVVILGGLRLGERVIASANFLVDSEAQLQAALGTFAPPPPGAGGAAAMNAAPAGSKVEQISADLTTEPSPPHKGKNTVRVRLTSPDGAAVSGAKVAVTFFMAGMPAMGMADMRSTADLSDKGNGTYEGQVELGSGGTWDVTITAQRNGQTIAQKRMNVRASGGM